MVKWLAKRLVRGESASVRWAPMELFVWPTEQIVDLASAKSRGVGLHQHGMPAASGGGGHSAHQCTWGRPVQWRKRTTGHLGCGAGSADEVVGAVPLGDPTAQARACRLALFLQDAAELQVGWKKIVGGSDFEG